MSVQTELTSVNGDALQITATERGDTTTIGLAGEWDLAGQEATRAAFHRALADRSDRLVLDLSRLSFIDSTGIHMTIDLAVRTRRLGVQLTIVPGPRAVHRVFEVCELTERLPFVK